MSGREHRSRYSRFQSERFQGTRQVRFHQSSHESRNRSPYRKRAHQLGQGTRDQRSHSEKGRQSSQVGRAGSRSAYTERWDDHRGQTQYSRRDTGRNVSSRDRRQQEERRDQWMYSRPQQQRYRVGRPFSGERSDSQHQGKKRSSMSAPSQRFVVVTSSSVPAVSQEFRWPWVLGQVLGIHNLSCSQLNRRQVFRPVKWVCSKGPLSQRPGSRMGKEIAHCVTRQLTICDVMWKSTIFRGTSVQKGCVGSVAVHQTLWTSSGGCMGTVRIALSTSTG